MRTEEEDTRDTLLIYIDTNKNFIDEKIYEDFGDQCTSHLPLKDISISKLAKTINDIFDFGKSKVFQNLYANLESTIQHFIDSEYSRPTVASFHELDIEKIAEIVKFCVKQGIKIPVQKPPDQQKTVEKKPEPKKYIHVQSPLPRQEKPIPSFNLPNFREIKPRISSFLDKNKVPQKKVFQIEKYSMPETHVSPKYLLSISKPPLKPQEPIASIIIPLEPSILLQNRQQFLDRLQNLFLYYCSQQQNVGNSPTFDTIKRQCEQMSLGKFLLFCKGTNLFQHAQIPKTKLSAAFKKVAQGRQEIDFAIFTVLLRKLDEEYQEIILKESGNAVGSFEARLLLNQPQRYQNLKKNVNLVFGTRDRSTFDTIAPKSVKHELTSHSGKFSSDLKNILALKAQIEAQDRNPAETMKPLSKLIGLNNLNTQKWPRIDWLHEEAAHGSHSGRKIVQDVKQRAIELERKGR